MSGVGRFPTRCHDAVFGGCHVEPVSAPTDCSHHVSAWLACAGTAPAHAAWLGNGVPICTEGHNQYPAKTFSDGSYGAIVVWEEKRSGEDVYAQRIGSSGVTLWSTNGISVCSNASRQINPTAALNRSYNSLVAWTDRRNGNNDVYAQQLNLMGVPLWTTHGIPIGSSLGYDEDTPVVISDQFGNTLLPGGWIVAWIADDGTKREVRVQHVSDDGSLSTPAGAGGVQITSHTTDLYSLAMVTDGIGTSSSSRGAVLTWQEIRSPGTTSEDIYARRIDYTGAVQWASNGVAVCTSTGSQTTPAIVNVGSGNVVIAWQDKRDGNSDLWAQKISSAGAIQWIANGLPVCRASGTQTSFEMITSSGGGVLLVWQDYREAEPKIYAQRLDANGLPLWDTDGIPLCPAAGFQLNPAAISDGAGGAIVVWQDRRTGTDDLYAQHVDANGNLMWPSSGVPVVGAAGNQDVVSVVSDSRSGAIATWRDHRNGNDDIYANRISSTGGVVDVPVVVGSKLRLERLSSNPTVGDVQLRLALPSPAHVTVEVADVLGRRVRSLASDARLGSGAHLFTWDGSDDNRASAPAGVYFVRVRADEAVLSTRVVRLR
jgi:hypothetical protein